MGLDLDQTCAEPKDQTAENVMLLLLEIQQVNLLKEKCLKPL